MEFKLEKEYNNNEIECKIYKSSSPIDLDSIISSIKNHENDTTKVYKIMVSLYDDDGHYGTDTFESLDDLQKLNDYSNPNMGFRAFYVGRDDNKYKYHLDASINFSYLTYEANHKIADLINKEIEKNRLKKENEFN